MLSKEELGNYLQRIRKDKELSLRDVEKLVGVGYAYLSMIENGKRNVTPALLRNLAKLYNVDYLDLYEKAGYIELIQDEKKQQILNNIPYMCPVYGRISAGQPNWAEECIEGKIPLDCDLMNIPNPEECFFLRVEGESMNKLVKNGGFALIHKQDTVENGDVAVVLVNGYDATLKKFSKQGDLIILEPQSTDETINTQVYGKDTSIKILGKYIGKFELN